MIPVLGLILFLTILISKIVLNYKYLSYREDSHYLHPIPLFDALIPHKRRVMYFKLFLSMILFPIVSKIDNEDAKNLKKYVNILVLSFYVVMVGLIAMAQY